MSYADLSAFFEKLQADAALQEKARALSGTDDAPAALCALAAAEGFTFTPEELSSEQAKPAFAALDDETLREVAGGAGCSVVGFFSPQQGAGQPLG
jgi:predicted ribosomally synthesized peptide with nif11-like leader